MRPESLAETSTRSGQCKQSVAGLNIKKTNKCTLNNTLVLEKFYAPRGRHSTISVEAALL